MTAHSHTAESRHRSGCLCSLFTMSHASSCLTSLCLLSWFLPPSASHNHTMGPAPGEQPQLSRVLHAHGTEVLGCISAEDWTPGNLGLTPPPSKALGDKSRVVRRATDNWSQ